MKQVLQRPRVEPLRLAFDSIANEEKSHFQKFFTGFLGLVFRNLSYF